MGWFSLWTSPSSSDPSSKDPSNATSTLDPTLKSFYKSTTPDPTSTPLPSQSTPSPTPRELESEHQSSASSTQTPPHEKPLKPLPYTTGSNPHQSAYGTRYSSYWQTYTPFSGHEQQIRADSGHQKAQDFGAAMRQRRAKKEAAARENCVFEEADYYQCITGQKAKPLWSKDTWTMCSHQLGRFAECVNEQKRLLDELGYWDDGTRPRIVDERIQMHADKLYRRLVEQDEAAERAGKEGRGREEAVEEVKRLQEGSVKTPDYTKLGLERTRVEVAEKEGKAGES